MRTILFDLDSDGISDFCREVCDADGYRVVMAHGAFGGPLHTDSESPQTHRQNPCAEELLSAFFDGELAGEDQLQIEQLLQQSSELRDCLQGLQYLSNRLQDLPTYQLGDQFTERVVRITELLSEGVALPDPTTEFSDELAGVYADLAS